jgi:hypothetical protein
MEQKQLEQQLSYLALESEILSNIRTRLSVVDKAYIVLRSYQNEGYSGAKLNQEVC